MYVGSQVRFVVEEGRRADPPPSIKELRYDGSVPASMPRPEMTDKGRSAQMTGAVLKRHARS